MVWQQHFILYTLKSYRRFGEFQKVCGKNSFIGILAPKEITANGMYYHLFYAHILDIGIGVGMNISCSIGILFSSVSGKQRNGRKKSITIELPTAMCIRTKSKIRYTNKHMRINVPLYTPNYGQKRQYSLKSYRGKREKNPFHKIFVHVFVEKFSSSGKTFFSHPILFLL